MADLTDRTVAIEDLWGTNSVRFAKEFMNAATDDFTHVGDLLQFFYGTGRDRVEVREVVRQRPRSTDADM